MSHPHTFPAQELPRAAGAPVRHLLVRAAEFGLSTVTLVALVALLAIGAASVAGIHPRVEQTGSMEPALSPGDLLFIKSIGAPAARVGDVVTFTAPGESTELTHRVVARRLAHGRVFFVTRGDANSGVERWNVSAQGTIGREVLDVPAAGRLIQIVRGRVFIVAVWLLCPFVLLGLVRRIWRRR